MDFKYKVSIIVPVYLTEKYLDMCVGSLINQTIDKDQMEILLIVDGSPDNSLDICQKYAEEYSFIKVFSKENEGLSATRNYGIKRAQGKYLMYIDSDDYFSPETVKDVTDFFDTVYDEVDLVTYYEQPYGVGKLLPSHFRFGLYLKKAGVYNLNHYPYILQMRVNVCVKNMGNDNELFNTTPNFMHEDQEYNNRVLMKKMKIGFCDTGCYYYNKTNENSIVTTKFNVVNLFEKSIGYLENLLSCFSGPVPEYFQAVCFHDLRWKFDQQILFPHHYEGQDYDNAIKRIKSILNRVDNDIIINYPYISENIMLFWLSFKENSNLIPYIRSNKLVLVSNGEIIYKRTKLQFVISTFQSLDNGNLLCRGYIETPIYSFLHEVPDLYVYENQSEEKKLSVYLSKFGYLNKKVNVLDYYAFEYEFDPKEVKRFSFYVKLDGFELVSDYSFKWMSKFNAKRKLFDIVFGNTLVSFRNRIFEVSEISFEERDRLETEHTYGYITDQDHVDLRLKTIAYRNQHKVWLYYDLYTVEKDNGYYQFIHDFELDDGVERYYVYSKPYEEIEHLFTEEQKKYLVETKSELHKLLYLSSELIFTAYYGLTPITPFLNEAEEVNFYDIEHFKVIYLQHGVLHASLFVQNSAENARADKIVISSHFERENYVNKYHYRPDALIDSSMARYDHIDRCKKPKGKILFAPSWRNYLSPNVTASKWETDLTLLKRSDYFQNIRAFLENERLIKALENNGITFELKLHPIIANDVDKLFDFKTDNIVMAEKNVEITDYDMFITDFSSFVFDYACLSRPIVYFVPDYTNFKSGMGHYRDLDLPFEKAFGPMAKDVESAVDYVVEIISNGFITSDLYRKRMDNFYFSLDNCCGRLYNYICEKMLPGLRGE